MESREGKMFSLENIKHFLSTNYMPRKLPDNVPEKVNKRWFLGKKYSITVTKINIQDGEVEQRVQDVC